jgi:hypothetical protein
MILRIDETTVVVRGNRPKTQAAGRRDSVADEMLEPVYLGKAALLLLRCPASA